MPTLRPTSPSAIAKFLLKLLARTVSVAALPYRVPVSIDRRFLCFFAGASDAETFFTSELPTTTPAKKVARKIFKA
jgi:hypothetical protein